MESRHGSNDSLTALPWGLAGDRRRGYTPGARVVLLNARRGSRDDWVVAGDSFELTQFGLVSNREQFRPAWRERGVVSLALS